MSGCDPAQALQRANDNHAGIQIFGAADQKPVTAAEE